MIVVPLAGNTQKREQHSFAHREQDFARFTATIQNSLHYLLSLRTLPTKQRLLNAYSLLETQNHMITAFVSDATV